ncbi:putative capsular polysaccharide synthesis family protein [Psychroserpens sp. Hel_I_66]|uniref:putative capsular polysaccharide synthesis family protein n=1 Tax=Psychroserpens sp. Hel_I_66 TaxID=1250004 RepID=UPI000A8BF41D|nr:putative capsular polysaccharide synthesis family protein [Psychroserpens sp. Hel_I_66]
MKHNLKRIYRFIKRQYFTKFGLDRDLYLVYTMSKVGSSTVYNSLKKKYPFKEIHHIHFLGDTWLDSFKTGHPTFNNNLKNASNLNKLLAKKRWNIKIISLTRDPIARDVSGIFQTWKHIFNVENITDVSAEMIIAHLKEIDFSYAQNWFETDFKEFTGFDIFEHEFNSSRGYEIYSCKKAELLIFQLEQLNSNFNLAMNRFIGKGEYKLHEENITASRASGELNTKVKQLLKLSHQQLENIYDSLYMSTFYNTSQIDKFKKRWLEELKE